MSRKHTIQAVVPREAKNALAKLAEGENQTTSKMSKLFIAKGMKSMLGDQPTPAELVASGLCPDEAEARKLLRFCGYGEAR